MHYPRSAGVCSFHGTTHTHTHFWKCVTKDAALFLLRFFAVNPFLRCATETEKSAYNLLALAPSRTTNSQKWTPATHTFMKEDLKKTFFSLYLTM